MLEARQSGEDLLVANEQKTYRKAISISGAKSKPHARAKARKMGYAKDGKPLTRRQVIDKALRDAGA